MSAPKEVTMTASQDEATGTQEHVAPPEAWDAIADGYDRYVAPQEVDLANEALRLVGLEPGQRFLDVAAGTGGLSLPAGRLGARVLAVDWSPAMIERFGARVREEGLSRAEGRVMDCHALELPDDSFDVTGRSSGSCSCPTRRVRFARWFGLTDAGLKDVRVERTVERPAFGSGQEMWDWVLYGNPIPGTLVADLTESQQASLRQVLDGMLRERAGANRRAVLTNAVNIGIGAK
jgi:SAM-dependent methyltransferase